MPAKHVCIIPARKGSKSIKNKNLIELNRRTLVQLAAERAFDSRLFDAIVVTSDYPKYRLNIDAIHSSGVTRMHYIRRPNDLCQDETPMVDVVKHAINNVGSGYQWVWLLQPTSPFREVFDFKRIKRMLDTERFESIISVKEVKEYSNRTYTGKDLEDPMFKDFQEGFRLRWTNFKNRQELPINLIRSGAFYVFKLSDLKEKESIENRPLGLYVMDRVHGLNIDDHEDVVLAKYYLNTGRVKV